MAVSILLVFLDKGLKPHHGTVFTLGLNLPRALGWFLSADKTSVVSADKTSVVSADKTSVVSADKTSVVSQDIP